MSNEPLVTPQRTMHIDDIRVGDRIRDIAHESIDELTDSIQELGLLYPVLVDTTGVLIDGLQRLEALRNLGIDEVPVLIDPDVTVGGHTDEELLRRELAANAARTQYTAVEAAAARRRLREMVGKAPQRRQGLPVAERRKHWSSELATAETGVSRSTMDRVDTIVRYAEDHSQPASVRRVAVTGLARIGREGAPVDRVLKEVKAAAIGVDVLARYPQLSVLPEAARNGMAAALDALPEADRKARLDALSTLVGSDPGQAASYQRLRDTKRIGELLDIGREAAAAARALQEGSGLPADLHHNWAAIANQLEDLARDLRTALSGDHS